MVDTTAAKNHLEKTESTLNSINKITEINALVDEVALNLTSVLGAKNELYIQDQETVDKLESIHNRLDRTKVNHLARDLKGQYDRYNIRVNNAYAAKRKPDANDVSRRYLYEINLDSADTGDASHNIDARSSEYEDYHTKATQFNLGGNYVDQTVELNMVPRPAVTIPLNTFCTVAPDESVLCDGDGNPLNQTGPDTYEITISGTTYKLKKIHKVGNTYVFTDMEVDPTNIDISKPLSLSVTGKYNATKGIKISCNKKFNINLSEGGPKNAGDRANEIDAYNAAIVGPHNVGEHLQSRLENEEAQIIRDAIARAVKKINSPVFDSLSEQQKEDFYVRIRDTAILPNLPNRGPVDGRTELSATLWITRGYNDFRDWFAANGRSWNKNPNITRTQKAYRQYFHDHFRDESKNYFDGILDNVLNDLDNETFLKAAVNSYLVEIDTNKRDNDNSRTALENPLTRRDIGIEKRRRWQLRRIFRNKDDNFMKFFSGTSKEIKNQVVNISTTTPGDPHDIGPIKYDMKINVPENNRIGVEIKINGQEPLILQSGDYDPTTLARRLLREPSIPTSKAKVHMVYSLYKGLLQLAKEKNIKLEYFDNGTPGAMREITLAPNGNIVLNSVIYRSTPPYDKESSTLFDEQLFQNTNQFDRTGGNNNLEEGILSIARHFSYAMNRMDRTYRTSTKRALWRTYRSEARMGLPTSFWTSPIRKIINMNNSTNFDFSTSVGNTRIDLKGNTFTVTTPECPKPIVSKDLGKILWKRVNKKRIFDGKERDIVEAVYSGLIKKMRENSKIARTNFGVVDDLTGHVYVLDSSGHFGRINRDALNGANAVHRFWGAKVNAGVISEKKLRGSKKRPGFAYQLLTPSEEKELLKNPLLMQGFVRAMNRRMGVVESVRAWFDRH